MKNELFYYDGENTTSLARFLSLFPDEYDIEPIDKGLYSFMFEGLEIKPNSVVYYDAKTDRFDFFLID